MTWTKNLSGKEGVSFFSFAVVILALAAVYVHADSTPPVPDPMTWAVDPYTTGSDSISMTATTAFDQTNVMYYFQCTAGPGHDSGWQISTTYTDIGLDPDTAYTYSVKARDSLITQLIPLTISANTGEKPQSKVWRTSDGLWWAVLPHSRGTAIWAVVGPGWIDVMNLSPYTNSRADVKIVGNVVHILLYRGVSSKLISVEYDVPSQTYQLWTQRPSTVDITLDSGVETATLDVDSTGRMWIASDASTTINVRYSDPPYDVWSSPITLASGVSTDDISVVTALANGTIGVLWSNQQTKRFGFRVHTDIDGPAVWSADEVPASQSAIDSVGGGMADDHLNVAVASDGTLYAAVKTSYDTAGYPKIAFLVRRPNGQWDDLYGVDTSGTRPITLLNEVDGAVTVFYTASEGSNDIVYKQSALSQISFDEAPLILMSGSSNNVSSMKDNVTDEAVLITSSNNTAYGIIMSPAGLNQTAYSVERTAFTDPDPGSGPIFDFAQSEIIVGSSSVVGGYTETYESDNIYEQITERDSGGRPNRRHSWLEHKWVFNIAGGDSITFFIEAYKSVSADGDNFVFAYSTDNSTYVNMLTVTNTADDDTQQTYVIPATTSGTVYIRVIDTDRSQGNRSQDTVLIDQMYIRSEGTGVIDTDPPTPDPMQWQVLPYASGSRSIAMEAITAGDVSGVEYYFTCTSGGGNDSGWQDSPLYEDTGLLPDTLYTYKVKARDKSAGQNETGFSSEASAQTLLAGDPPGQAADPNPADGQTGVNRKNVILNWTAGKDATSHDIYLGTANPPPFVQNQTGTVYDPQGNLFKNTWYYWRIDEVNADGTTTGVIWSFYAE
jgi:hypothetical protein